jgi:hypothetical protein
LWKNPYNPIQERRGPAQWLWWLDICDEYNTPSEVLLSRDQLAERWGCCKETLKRMQQKR